MAGERTRIAVAGLAMAGAADALYMLAYHTGLIDSLACPFFGSGCNRVGRSPQAKHLGIPNAAVGVAGYATMAVLSLARGGSPDRQRLQAAGLAASSLSAVAASIYLIWAQAFQVKAWCFWCLSSAAINFTILPLVLRDGLRSLRELLPRDPTEPAVASRPSATAPSR